MFGIWELLIILPFIYCYFIAGHEFICLYIGTTESWTLIIKRKMRRNLKIVAFIGANAILGYILSKFTSYTNYGVLIKRHNDNFLGQVNKLLLYFIAVDWIFEMSHIALMLDMKNIQFVQLFFFWLWTKYCMSLFTFLNIKA